MKARHLKNLNLYMRPILDGVLIVGVNYPTQFGAFRTAGDWKRIYWD